MRECIDCEFCKSLTNSEGEEVLFCMDVNGGNYLGVTGICGFCSLESEEEEE